MGVRIGDPVLLVPGFLAGDGTLALMSKSLRRQGFRTYRSDIRANVGCTLAAAAQLEERLEEISQRGGDCSAELGCACEILYALEVLVINLGHSDTQPCDSSSFGRAAAEELEQQIVGDAEHPGTTGG